MKKKIAAVLMVLVLLVSGAMFVSAQVSSSNTDNGSITVDAPCLTPPVTITPTASNRCGGGCGGEGGCWCVCNCPPDHPLLNVPRC